MAAVSSVDHAFASALDCPSTPAHTHHPRASSVRVHGPGDTHARGGGQACAVRALPLTPVSFRPRRPRCAPGVPPPCLGGTRMAVAKGTCCAQEAGPARWSSDKGGSALATVWGLPCAPSAHLCGAHTWFVYLRHTRPAPVLTRRASDSPTCIPNSAEQADRGQPAGAARQARVEQGCQRGRPGGGPGLGEADPSGGEG